MKSSIHTLYDYRNFPFEHRVKIFSLDSSTIAKKEKSLTSHRKTKISADKVQDHDVILLTLTGSDPQFNKGTIPVTVGGGLLNDKLESQLLGMDLNSTKNFEIDGIKVEATVTSIDRYLYPAPTDEDVCTYVKDSYDMKDVQTVGQFFDFLEKKNLQDQKDSTIYGTMQDILDAVLTKSDWEFDESEFQECYNASLKEVLSQCELSPDALDALDDHTVQTKIGLSSKEEFLKFLREDCERRIASTLWIAHCNGLDLKTTEADDPRLQNCDFLENYVRQSITFQEVKA